MTETTSCRSLRLEPGVRLSPHRAQHLRSFSRTKHPEAFLRISPAPRPSPWTACAFAGGPLLQSFRRLGACAIGTHPRVHGFPVRRLLCPSRLSSGASSFCETLPSHYFPTALPIHQGVSRVPHGRRTSNEVGGVLLLAPSALCGSPVFRQRVEQVDRWHRGPPDRGALVLTLPARVGFQVRLADISAKVCQGQPCP
jgi:hypothetical protein